MSITRTLSILTLCGASALLAQAPQGKGKGKARPDPGPPKIHVLIITGINAHDWKGTTPVLRQTLEDTGKFDVRVVEEFRGAGPETLAPYDVVVLNHAGKRIWGERTEKAFEDYVASGKGLVIYHFALSGFDGWTEFEKMSGANWRTGHGDHSPKHDWTVNIKDSEHPITKGLKDFMVWGRKSSTPLPAWQPEGTYHVLATAWDDHSLSNLCNQVTRSPDPAKTRTFCGPRNTVKARCSSPRWATMRKTSRTSISRSTSLLRRRMGAATGKVTQAIPPELAKQLSSASGQPQQAQETG